MESVTVRAFFGRHMAGERTLTDPVDGRPMRRVGLWTFLSMGLARRRDQLKTWWKRKSGGLLNNEELFTQMEQVRAARAQRDRDGLMHLGVSPNQSTPGRVSPSQIAPPPPPVTRHDIALPLEQMAAAMVRLTEASGGEPRPRGRVLEGTERAEQTRREVVPPAVAPVSFDPQVPVRAALGPRLEINMPGVDMQTVRTELNRDVRESVPMSWMSAMSYSTFSSTRAMEPAMRTSRAGASIQFGRPLVFGAVAENKRLHLSGWPSDKVRLKFRPDEFARAFVRMPNGIREYFVEERDGVWVPGPELARNERPQKEEVVVRTRGRKLKMTE